MAYGDVLEEAPEELSKSLKEPVGTPPEILAPKTEPLGPSLASKLITVMEKGYLDPTPDEEARAPVTSRQWSNRKAKAAANKIVTNTEADVYSIDLQDIWANVLKSEGGYANNPADPGGETNFGISKRSYPKENIQAMTPERAQEIFKSDFFDAVGGETLMKINPGLAAHASDMAFNAGPRAAIKLLYDAAGMKRETQITPELIDALNGSEEIVKNYSVARLRYYASLGNAPTFIKGWTNRVNNLNKALKIKSGLNGAYKAARNLDIDALVQYAFTADEQLAPRFAELNEQELERLRRANEMLSPGYRKPAPPVGPTKQPTSSIGEVFNATYDAKYYTNTIAGMNELSMRAVLAASDANRKALGDKYKPSILQKMSFGLYGGVGTIEDWEKEVKQFKTDHPEVKLPYESASQVYAMVQSNAKQIEDRYNALDTGSFKDGIAASLSKVGKVVLGYLPGEILGSMNDPLEAVINLAPLPGAGTAAGVAKGMLATFLGTGAVQTVVQPKRQEIGLEGGVEEGVVNAATAAAGQGVLGSLTGLASKLFKAGSKEAGEETLKAVESLKKAMAAEEATPDTQHALRELDLVTSQAKELIRNPYGDSVEAKTLYEANRANAMSDLLEGKPVRELDTAVTNVLDNSEKLINQAKLFAVEMDDPEAYLAAHAQGIKEWTKFKKSQVSPDAVPDLKSLEKDPIYKDITEFEPQTKFKSEMEVYLSQKLTDIDKRYAETLKPLEAKDPLIRVDIGEGETEELVSIGTTLQEFKDTRTGLQEMFSCMTGGPDKAVE